MSSRLRAAISVLFLASAAALGQNVLVDSGFEQPKLAWAFTEGYGMRSAVVKDNVHGGTQALKLATFNVTDRFATVTQSPSLAKGVYELTCWAKGSGKFRLSAKGIGMRPFAPAGEWSQYSYVFEVTEPGSVTVMLEALGEVTVDDASLTPADDALRAAWARQQQALEQFYYIPGGYSAQRPEPNAPPQTISDRKPVAIAEKVVFYDARYEGSWNTECDKIADWFVRRGFTAKGAPALAQWLQERIDARTAYGSAVVMAMGLVPAAVITPLDHSCLLRRYLDAGGRIVWTGNTALYVAQAETGPAYNPGEAGMGNLLDMTCDWGIWTQEAPQLTATGKRWGLQGVGSSIRAARRSEVTLSLSENPSGASAVWLKTTNPAYPLSGFIAAVFGLGGSNTAALEDFYRLALFTGEPVTVPSAEAQQTPPAPFALTLTTVGQKQARRAFTRGETVQVTATVTGNAPQGTLALALTDGAPPFTRYDQAAIGVETAVASVDNYAKTLATRRPLWQQAATAGTPGALPTASLAPGDYLLRASFTGADGKLLAESAHPIAICAKPRSDGIYFGTRGPAPTNAYRLEDYLLELRRLNLQGLEIGGPTPVFADALLRYGLSFVPHFDPRGYLTEKRIDKDGKEVANPWAGGKPGLVGLAGAQAPVSARKGMEERARQVAGYPALRNVFTTSDDFSALGGPDYCPANTEAFKRLTGLEAPREPTAKPGIVADDDPWLLWNTFVSRDVLGQFNDAIRRGLDAGSPGARVWPVPGGAQVPLFSTYSAQYPPFNFGTTGFNTVGYYCYLSYWAPTIAYLYWSEVARLANRDLPVWVMPDASDSRHYLRNMAHMLLAGNTKGIVYFTYDWMKPEGRKEIAELGDLIGRYGPLLANLKPAAKPAALLVPFSQSVYSENYPLSRASMAFSDLVQSHADVELLAEEELAASPHRVIFVAGLTHLRASSVRALESLAGKGTVIVTDKDTSIPVTGTRKLGFALGGVEFKSEGRLAHLAQVKQALQAFGLADVDSPENTTLVRTFTDAGGGSYLYLVQTDTAEEYGFYRRNIYEVGTFGRDPAVPKEQINAFLAEHGMMSNLKDTVMTVTFPAAFLPGNWEVVDLYRGATLPVTPAGGDQWQVTVTTRRFGGALLALRPRAKLAVEAPATAKRGDTVTFTITLPGMKGAAPLRVTLTDPSGKADSEVSGCYATDANGSLRLAFQPGTNAPPGKWKLTVTELGSGQSVARTVKVK